MFGIDLEEVILARTKSWRWFTTRIGYLLQHDNPLARRFAPKPDTPDEELPNFDL